MTPDEIKAAKTIDLDNLEADEEEQELEVLDIETCLSKVEQGYSDSDETIIAMQASPDGKTSLYPCFYFCCYFCIMNISFFWDVPH